MVVVSEGLLLKSQKEFTNVRIAGFIILPQKQKNEQYFMVSK